MGGQRRVVPPATRRIVAGEVTRPSAKSVEGSGLGQDPAFRFIHHVAIIGSRRLVMLDIPEFVPTIFDGWETYQ